MKFTLVAPPVGLSSPFGTKFFPAAILALLVFGLTTAKAATSEWVHPDAAGKLVYKSTPAGDRIMDFSYAGYMGGGVALPDVLVKETVQPSGGADDSDAIQAAIDRVGAMPLTNGFRGAVLLAPGTFTCSKPLLLSMSGVVVRGSGSGATGTIIKMTGAKHVAFAVGERRSAATRGDGEDSGNAPKAPARSRADQFHTTITDAYVPSGARSFTVSDAKGLVIGDVVTIRRPTTASWTELMQMHNLVRDGKKQTWLGVGRSVDMIRQVTAIAGNVVTIDAPLADSLDAHYLNPPGTVVAKATLPPRVSQVGVEQLHIQCPAIEVDYGHATYSAIHLDADDAWARDVQCEETISATVLTGRRITMEAVTVTHTFPNLGASKPSDFSIEGSQILIDRCATTGDNEYSVWTSSGHPGPNVVLNSTFRGRGSYVQPHHRWSTGLLVDNCTVPDGGIDFMNRGVAGSGHGWAMGWAVAWNCVTRRYIIQNPPGTMNWAIGNIGTRMQQARLFDTAPVLPDGTYDSHGSPVTPQSLYLAQLAERLGPSALRAIGYTDNTLAMFPNKNVPRLPEWKVEVDPQLGPDLATHRPVDTSGVRGATREFGGEKALDGNPATYWATDDGAVPARFEVDVEGPLEINAVVLEEAAGMLGNIKSYKVEGQVGSDWKLLGEGTAIGEHTVLKFPEVVVWKVKLTVLKAEPYTAIRKFGLYHAK